MVGNFFKVLFPSRKEEYYQSEIEENISDLEVVEEKTYEDRLFEKYGYCNTVDRNKIKILFITDTHNIIYCERYINMLKEIKEYDVCILLGDLSSNDLYEILKIVPKEKIYGVLGNHDPWNRLEEYSINNINGKVINVNGVKIAGIGGSFKYKDSDKYALITQEESLNILKNLEDIDILVSHDRAFLKDTGDVAHDGLKGITECIYRNHIPLHIHGHLHEEFEEELKNNCKSICLYQIRLLEI